MRAMPRLLLLLFCMSMVTMMFIARCGLNIDSQLLSGQNTGLPMASPGEKALREVMRRREVEHFRDKSALHEKIKTLETQLTKVQDQVVNLTYNLQVPQGRLKGQGRPTLNPPVHPADGVVHNFDLAARAGLDGARPNLGVGRERRKARMLPRLSEHDHGTFTLVGRNGNSKRPGADANGGNGLGRRPFTLPVNGPVPPQVHQLDKRALDWRAGTDHSYSKGSQRFGQPGSEEEVGGELATRGISYPNFPADYLRYIHDKLNSTEILHGQAYKTEYELIPFTRFTHKKIFMVEPGLGKRVVEKPIGYKKRDLNEIIAHAVDSLNANRSSSSLYSHSDFAEGIYRTDPSSGSHYELYFRQKDDGNRNKPSRSYVKISIIRPFSPPLTVQNKVTHTGNQLINIILPLSGRLEAFRLFMEQFVEVCVKDSRVFLTVVYFGNEGLKEVKAVMGRVAKTHRFKQMKLVTLDEKFTRGRGLQIGALNWKHGDVLLFFCDVDIQFTSEFLERCRLNAEPGQRVYYPIVFSLYNPKLVYSLQELPLPPFNDQLVLSRDTGFWRDFGYGMTCQYRSDFLRIKGFDEQITGWGGEDVFLYQKFVRSDYFVVRATDPAIFHLWHEKFCDPTLSDEQYRSCIHSKALNEASHAQLGLLAFKDEINVHRSVSEKNILKYTAMDKDVKSRSNVNKTNNSNVKSNRNNSTDKTKV